MHCYRLSVQIRILFYRQLLCQRIVYLLNWFAWFELFSCLSVYKMKFIAGGNLSLLIVFSFHIITSISFIVKTIYSICLYLFYESEAMSPIHVQIICNYDVNIHCFDSNPNQRSVYRGCAIVNVDFNHLIYEQRLFTFN